MEKKYPYYEVVTQIGPLQSMDVKSNEFRNSDLSTARNEALFFADEFLKEAYENDEADSPDKIGVIPFDQIRAVSVSIIFHVSEEEEICLSNDGETEDTITALMSEYQYYLKNNLISKDKTLTLYLNKNLEKGNNNSDELTFALTRNEAANHIHEVKVVGPYFIRFYNEMKR